MLTGSICGIAAGQTDERTATDTPQVTDVHCHNVFPWFKDFLKGHGAEMDENFPLPDWDVESHLEFMEKAGISLSVLSMPAPQPYFGDSGECRETIRRYNEESAGLKSGYPGKFLFCAALPLPDVDAAIDEAIFALDSLGADGIKLATNNRGQYLGDPALDPLMSVLNDRGATVILHPHKPVPVNGELTAVTPLAAYEYPAETTRAVLNMISHNVPARFPEIKFVIPHCGSFLPLAIPRARNIQRAMAGKGVMPDVSWEENLKNLYYDLAGGATEEVLEALLTITTPDHLLYGSDYPYQPDEALSGGLRRLKELTAGNVRLAPFAEDILHNNAARLFGQETASGNGGETASRGMVKKREMEADGIVRLSKVEVHPGYIDEYMEYAVEVGEISLRTEPGVLTMYAVRGKDNPCVITILETYASQADYRSHIESEHFRKYKQGTLHMVKNLVLSDQTPLNPANRIVNFMK